MGDKYCILVPMCLAMWIRECAGTVLSPEVSVWDSSKEFSEISEIAACLVFAELERTDMIAPSVELGLEGDPHW